MEHTGYTAILDAMGKTGIYVVDEKSHRVLYLNKQAREASPGMEPGAPCLKKLNDSCSGCPLLAIGERAESRSVSYSPRYGGMVDAAAARILWEDRIPAFLITVHCRQLKAKQVF